MKTLKYIAMGYEFFGKDFDERDGLICVIVQFFPFLQPKKTPVYAIYFQINQIFTGIILY